MRNIWSYLFEALVLTLLNLNFPLSPNPPILPPRIIRFPVPALNSLRQGFPQPGQTRPQIIFSIHIVECLLAPLDIGSDNLHPVHVSRRRVLCVYDALVGSDEVAVFTAPLVSIERVVDGYVWEMFQEEGGGGWAGERFCAVAAVRLLAAGSGESAFAVRAGHLVAMHFQKVSRLWQKEIPLGKI
jgi:hypothetical protein